MTNTTDKSTVLVRVQKLLAKAESAKEIGSLEEANAFVAKANQIMLEHNLSMVEVHMKDDDTQLSSSSVSFLDNMAGNLWRVRLMTVLCSYNFCVCTVRRHDKTLIIYGDKDNVDVVMFLYSNVAARIYNLGVSTYLGIPKAERPHKRYDFLKNFVLGAVNGLRLKLAEVRAEQAAANNQVTSLVVNSEARIMQKLLDTKQIKNKEYKAKATANPDSVAYRIGKATGYNMDLQEGLGSTKPAGEIN
jgi:hypothetical protein